MERRPIRAIVTLAFLLFALFALTIGTVQISAQQPTPTPGAPVTTPIATLEDLERRVYRLEVAYTQTIETIRAWESISEQTINIAATIGVLFTVLVGIQGLATGIHLRREGRALASRLETERQARETDRTGLGQVSQVMNAVRQTLESRLEIERTGIGQVSSIMNVVQQTLESHLETEKRAREMVERVEEQLAEALKGLKPLQELYSKLQATIKGLREGIEEHAFQLAQTSRHDFRRKTDDLNSFAQKFDTFTTEFETLEEEREGEPRPQFSSRVLYIRGIVAHYANQPENARQYLEKVVRSRGPLSDEDQHNCDRRVAIAYYYLGLTQSNFGNYQAAIDFFEKANQLDPKVEDFLTRIATAEAYVMVRDFDKAVPFITQVEKGVLATEKDKDGRLLNFYLRLQSRAVLVKANMTILRRGDNWPQEVQDLLWPVYRADPHYYYATATLAQVYYDQGNHDKAKELFSEAYATIQQSGNLITVTEARSRILVLMVAGMCCKHGFEEDRWSKEHLDRANSLLGSLPKMGLQTCTVFSTLSKRNEDIGTIRDHIEKIRESKIFL